MRRKITIWGFEYYSEKGIIIGAQNGHLGPDIPTVEELNELKNLINVSQNDLQSL